VYFVKVNKLRFKAAVLEKYNEPLVIKEIEAQLQNNEVAIKVKATGICGMDIVIWRSGFRNLTPPLVLGHEIFGELEEKPVGIYSIINCGRCKYCVLGKENLCLNSQFLGMAKFGGFAEYVIVPRDNIFQLPDKEYVKYAATVEPLATSIHAAKLALVKKGKTILVTGAGGGVGIHMIQYLKYLGARVVSITSESKKEAVKRYSDEVITEKDFSRYIKDVDVVMELVGSETINESLRALSREGILVLVGNVTGSEITLKRPALTILREQRIIGSASYTRKEVDEAIKLIRNNVVKAIYKEYEFESINEAITDLLHNKILGRAVLII
jgi:D-arabinose 1-dehydrogenase-like Zn-dependent alcohol dehydrogenase